MIRENIKGKDLLKVFHTQDSTHTKLSSAKKCNRGDAWLGVGYYFWVDEEFAHFWGKDSKKRYGKYDIYSAHIDEEGFLNATFSEQEYYFFQKSIEKARKHLVKNLSRPVKLGDVHKFLADKVWPSLNIKGIIFDDVPKNAEAKGRIYSDLLPLYYKKRIQVVVFNEGNILNFAPHILNEKCN